MKLAYHPIMEIVANAELVDLHKPQTKYDFLMFFVGICAISAIAGYLAANFI